MHLLGFTISDFLKTGLAAVIFILFAKWLAPKTGVQALAAAAERV